MKDKHVKLSSELIYQVEEYMKKNDLNFSQAIRTILEVGLNNINLTKSLNLNNSLLDKIYSRQAYTVELIEQFYTDMEIEKVLNPNNNKALQKFKSSRNKDINYDK